MKYLTFLPRFHDPVRSGRKTSTIRPSARIRPGERFGLRYWDGKPYGKGVAMSYLSTATCATVEDIEVFPAMRSPSVKINGLFQSNENIEALALREGFSSTDDFMQYFLDQGRLIQGKLIRWNADTLGMPLELTTREEVERMGPVRIWSGQWSAWWRHPANGYTDQISAAGVYTGAEAWAHTHHSGPEKQILFQRVEVAHG